MAFICIQDFMVNELNLSRNELLVYAVIYGFSQDGETKFTGSLKYLQKWTNSTRQGVLKNIKSLIDKKLIEKKEIYKNNVKFCEYNANLNALGCKQSLQGASTLLTRDVNFIDKGCKQSLHNNINNNINDNINDNICDFSKIIDYLNKKTGKHFKPDNLNAIKCIKERFNEKYSYNDFIKVIDNMCIEWKGNDKMEKYLQPSTLFGSKFDNYLNLKTKQKYCNDDGYDVDFNL